MCCIFLFFEQALGPYTLFLGWSYYSVHLIYWVLHKIVLFVLLY
jgi:hypothetical protein